MPLNPFYLSDAMRDVLAAKVRRNNAVAVWFYAPGFVQEGGSFSDEAVRGLTGIRAGHLDEEGKPELRITRGDHPITAECGATTVLGAKRPYGPVFFANDPEATVLARLSPGDQAGLVVREFDRWRSVYFATPRLTTQLVRGLVRYAGGHVYSTSDDIIDASSRFVMMHSSSEGTKRIALPAPRRVTDVLSGRELGVRLDTIQFETSAGETRIFQLDEPK